MDKIIELRKQIYHLQYEHYTNVTLFSLRWWIFLTIGILFVIIWWKLVDKMRFLEITSFGFLIMFLIMIANSFGLEMVLWAYPMQLFELANHISEMELIVLTILYMLIYQYFSEWKKYIPSIIVFAALLGFGGVALSVKLGIYVLINWNYVYSFIVLMCLGIVGKFIVSKVMQIQKRSLKT